MSRELMQQALDALVMTKMQISGPITIRAVYESINALREALEAPQPEQPRFAEWTSDYVRDNLHKLKVHPEQQPVAWIRKNGFRFNGEIEPQDDFELPLYLPPPAAAQPAAQRTWVGLTPDEVANCIKFPGRNLFARDGTTSQRIARAIEAKLKEKNT